MNKTIAMLAIMILALITTASAVSLESPTRAKEYALLDVAYGKITSTNTVADVVKFGACKTLPRNSDLYAEANGKIVQDGMEYIDGLLFQVIELNKYGKAIVNIGDHVWYDGTLTTVSGCGRQQGDKFVYENTSYDFLRIAGSHEADYYVVTN